MTAALSFYHLARQPLILAAARQILTKSYVSAAAEQAAATAALMDEAFTRLQASLPDETSFQKTIAGLREEVFRKGDPSFWFNQIYREYKLSKKPQHRLERLLPFLKGTRVLDYGCGDGLTSLSMEKAGYAPFLTDVLDYRHPQACHLPFQPLSTSRTQLFPGEQFDTAVLFAVLHHVAVSDLSPLLTWLRSAASRIIIEEDSYMVPEDLLTQAHSNGDPEQMALFHSLSGQDQLRLLAFIDYFANAITQGLPQMDMPFNFHPVADWQEIFLQHGFRIVHTQLMGFQRGLFNRSCHVWFILEARA